LEMMLLMSSLLVLMLLIIWSVRTPLSSDLGFYPLFVFLCHKLMNSSTER
jgi:hypothetical protein